MPFSARRTDCTILSLPTIKLKILEAFIYPRNKGKAILLSDISIHNTIEVVATIPRDYTLAYTVNGNPYESTAIRNLEDCYVATYRQRETYNETLMMRQSFCGYGHRRI